MRPGLQLLSIFVSAVIVLTACQNGSRRQSSRNNPNNPAATPSPVIESAPDDGVRRVTVEELRVALAENRAVVLDVRGPVEYEVGHIRGARLLPLGQIAARAAELPRAKLIVTYCA